MSKARYNGKLHVPSEYDILANNNYFSRNSEVHSKKWQMLLIPDYNAVKNSFVFYP